MATKSQICIGITMASLATSSSYSSSSSSSITLSMIRKPHTTSFYNGGAGALKLEVVRVVAPSTKQHQSRRQRGAALVARMSLFGRFAMVIKSYANAIMSSFEDPERILEQAVLEMNGDLTKMRQATAQVMASRKRLENKHQAAQQASENWYRKAQLALRQGEEDLAREALRRRKTHADDASSLKAQLDQQKGVVDNLVMNTRLLESKIQQSMSKKDTLKARFRSAKIASEVSEMVGNVDTSSALLAFAKMEEKVSTMEALGQVSMNDLEGKFAMLESSSFVEDDLENLKKQLSGGSNLKKKGELPPGRSVVAAASNNGAYLLKDCEIDMELNELRTVN